MQLLNLPNPISLLQLEEEYGDPFYHLVGPYHSLDTSFWWIDFIVTRSVLIDLFDQQRVVITEIYAQRAECQAYQVSRQSFIIFMFIALIMGVLVYAATK